MMKKLHWMIAAAAGLLLISGAVQAQGLIATTAHNLSDSTAWGADGTGDTTDDGQVCVYCHTPHKALTLAPLWNKTYTPGAFTPYGPTATMSQIPGAPGAQSLACLSCHDGTIGTDSLANPPGLTTAFTGVDLMTNASLAFVGTSLTDDHPIGITYATSVTSDGAALVASPITSVLYGGKVECATCHSVHDNNFGSFLREDNTDSMVCYDCHNK